ncbi:pyridoxal phosphate-dependent transferase [Gymnopilus junonius]|uniref:Pyridoxal phosphate-dependent transferase n=1 Tax=Gymnopilus junonius TaxID=109634 RepID=A0A9P5N8M4_GYMJU|nr:pyridoxal phosphate-dependent transferase [Gymnopilus junonius]
MEWPALIELAPQVFPRDVIERAKELSREIGSVGAYSHSQGVPFIRQSVAKFIEERDGFPSDPSHIFLTAGASAGVSLLINALITSPKSGILIPIPQYPLYTASLAQHQGLPIPYYLDESKGWSTSVSSIEAALEEAHKEGIAPKGLVIINPGNPTGAVLDEETQEKLVHLYEVYQDNLHRRDSLPFTSFKKVVSKLQSHVPLVSFHSISKGVSGECGRRGGYFECTNFSDDVVALLYKMVSVTLCPPLTGQIGVNCMVRPPKLGEESYELWKKETDTIHASLASRTQTMAERLNSLPGVSCVDSPGALYLFPQISISKKAREAAQAVGQHPDEIGFGQKEGEWHYRLTCLCPV